MEDGFEPVREVIVEVRRRDRDHAEAQGGGDDDQVHVVLVLHLGQGADAARCHGAEQHDTGATEHGGRYGGNDPAHDRQQAQHHQDHAPGRHHITAFHAGHGHQADVLGEGALGEGAEDRRQDARRHVSAQTIAQALGVDLGVDDLANRQDVRRGFHQGHDDHDAHRQDRGDVEGRHAEVEGRRHRHQRTVRHLAEVGHAQRPGDQGTDDHGQQDRQARDRGTAQFAQQQHDGEGQGGQADVFHAAEVRRLAVATHHPAGRDRHQGQADGGDDDTGHQWREELGDAREDRRDQEAQHRRSHDRTQDTRQTATAFSGKDRAHGGDTGKGNPLHQRQLAAEERQAEGLQQGGQATGEQRGSDQQTDLGGSQTGRLAENQGNRNDTAVHRQNVLQTIGQVRAEAEVFVFRTRN